eukprot:scaffold224539_cov13-Tisochrysis_lutea.AAC.1
MLFPPYFSTSFLVPLQLGSDRNASTPGSFWNSAECARLDYILHGQLNRRAPLSSPLRYTTIPVSFGFDLFEIYSSKNRSTGVICMKMCVTQYNPPPFLTDVMTYLPSKAQLEGFREL